jgi:hypothetical protein
MVHFYSTCYGAKQAQKYIKMVCSTRISSRGRPQKGYKTLLLPFCEKIPVKPNCVPNRKYHKQKLCMDETEIVSQ